MSYAFRVYAATTAAPEVPRSYWLSKDMRQGLGATSLRSERWIGSLDEAERMKPTLRVGPAAGVSCRFGELWVYEMVPAETPDLEFA